VLMLGQRLQAPSFVPTHEFTVVEQHYTKSLTHALNNFAHFFHPHEDLVPFVYGMFWAGCLEGGWWSIDPQYGHNLIAGGEFIAPQYSVGVD
jgi:hypothetical protein